MQMQQVTTDGKTTAVPVTPTILDTPTGLVVIWGHELVSKRLLEVLGIVLSHDAFETIYHGIKSVVFRVDGYPKEHGKSVCAAYAPDTGGIAINMVQTLERAIDRAMDHPETSMMACWWIEMLLNFGHETHHGVRWMDHRDELYKNEEARAEEEKRAEKYAEALIISLAKEYDIELPASPEEEVWFNGQLNEMFSGKDTKDPWTKSQRQMITDNLVWKLEPEDGPPIEIHTFKDFICLISDEDIESEEWNKPTIVIKPGEDTLDEQLNGKKVIIDTTGDVVAEVIPVSKPATNAQPYDDNYDIDTDYCYEEVAAKTEARPIAQTDSLFAPDTALPVANSQPPVQPQQQEVGVQQDMTEVNRIAKQVYMKMYNFIFQNCEPLKESDVGFANPEAVLSSYLPLTEEESAIFVSMNHLDINGRWCPNVVTTSGLLGKVMKKTRLPAYEVTLCVNGVHYKRLFMPQNPAKIVNGKLTQRAQEARAGNAIAYIIDSGDNVDSKWGPYIINGEYKLPQAK